MRRPSEHTMRIGHPVIATTVQFFGGGMAILCAYVGTDALLPGLAAGFLVAEATRAANAVQKYQRWLAICEEVDGVPVRRRARLRTYVRCMAACVVALLLIGLLSRPGSAAPTIRWVILLAVATILVRFIRRFRRRGARATKPTTVQVIARCVMAPVPLGQAHGMLPDHCRRILTQSHQ